MTVQSFIRKKCPKIFFHDKKSWFSTLEYNFFFFFFFYVGVRQAQTLVVPAQTASVVDSCGLFCHIFFFSIKVRKWSQNYNFLLRIVQNVFLQKVDF